MRDVVLSLVMFYLLLKTIRKAEVGVYLWTWLSLMNPHKMTFGFAFSIPFAHLTALTTLASLAICKTRKPLPLNGGVVLMLALWFWMTVTSVATINPTDLVWERWVFVSKIYFMTLVTFLLIRERQQTDKLVWVVVLSLGYFGVKGGLFTVATGGEYRVWGPPGGMLSGNNELAVGLMILLPLMYYLAQTRQQRWSRWAFYAAMLAVGASIFGSQSRGALVGLLCMSTVLGLKSKHPIRFTLFLMLFLMLGVAFMPDSWTDRMGTIQSYESEGSAMSRIWTWKTMLNVALDRPLVGAGFAADNAAVFQRYAPTDAQYESFQGSVYVAHSIYMQALGEHGFVGLALYLGIWIWLWFAAAAVARQAAQFDDLKDWVPLLMRMCQVSTVGYLAGGAFLSLMVLDLPYYLLIFVTLCQCAVKDRLRGAKLPQAGPGRPHPQGMVTA